MEVIVEGELVAPGDCLLDAGVLPHRLDGLPHFDIGESFIALNVCLAGLDKVGEGLDCALFELAG